MSSLSLWAPMSEDVDSLMLDVRQVDREEWLGGTLARDLRSYLKSAVTIPDSYSRAVLLGGRCLCIWGVHDLPDHPDVGQAWLIATNEALRHVVGISRFQRAELAAIDTRWRTLMAWSLVTNTVHHAWMRRMGFRQAETTTHALGLPYLAFIRHRE